MEENPRKRNNKLSKQFTEKRLTLLFNCTCYGINRFDNKIDDGFRNKLKADREVVCVRLYYMHP